MKEYIIYIRDVRYGYSFPIIVKDEDKEKAIKNMNGKIKRMGKENIHIIQNIIQICK